MCQYSAEDGTATDWHLQHLMQLAISRAGLVMVEATGVERAGRITPPLPRPLLGRQRGRHRACAGGGAQGRGPGDGASASSWLMPGARPPAARPGKAASRWRTARAPGRPSRPPPSPLPRAGRAGGARRRGACARHGRVLPGRQSAPHAWASRSSSCTPPTATCCTSSYPRSPTSAPTAYGGSLENRMRFPLEVAGRCARPPRAALRWVRASPAPTGPTAGSTADDAVTFARCAEGGRLRLRMRVGRRRGAAT